LQNESVTETKITLFLKENVFI